MIPRCRRPRWSLHRCECGSGAQSPPARPVTAPANQEGRLLTHPLSTRSALEVRRAARLCSALDLRRDTVDIYHGMRFSLTTLTGSPRASLVSQKGPSEEGEQTGPLVGEPAPLCPDSGGLIPAGTCGKASAHENREALCRAGEK